MTNELTTTTLTIEQKMDILGESLRLSFKEKCRRQHEEHEASLARYLAEKNAVETTAEVIEETQAEPEQDAPATSARKSFTKKAFVSALKQADAAMVLGPVTGMSAAQRNGCTILAVERAAQKFLGVSIAAGMTSLTIEMGKTRKAPKWFSNMMIHVSWNARDLNVIRIGDLLAQC